MAGMFDLYRPLGPFCGDRKARWKRHPLVTVKAGSHKGKRGILFERLTADGDDRSITGLCRYGVRLVEQPWPHLTTTDFCRFELTVHTDEQARKLLGDNGQLGDLRDYLLGR